MLTDSVDCTIERRLLINYRIDPDVAMQHLPAPFRPQLVSGWAVGGVCLIRLGQLRPSRVPAPFGMTTENVAHRFAVEWDDDKGTQAGVYVPRRDTNSRITSLAGGRVFPADHRLARFQIDESGSEIRIGVESRDGALKLSVTARESSSLGGELFASVDEAIDFFRRGSLGYSASGTSDCLVGVRLLSQSWEACAVTVDHVTSSVFDDTDVFPAGSCVLDSGLVMRDLPARWQTEGPLRTESIAAIR